MSQPRLRILSLGAGVQSTALALMAERGNLPMLDAAIFADTGWEPKAVYDNLRWIKSVCSFPIYSVQRSNIRADLLAGTNSTGQRFCSVPVFSYNRAGKKNMLRRQCTREYKIAPIQRKMRELLGLKKGQRASAGAIEQWIGISGEESRRAVISRDKWIDNRYPLLGMKMKRQDCLEWIADNFAGYVPPRSACIGCPFRQRHEWLALTQDELKDAARVDSAIRNGAPAQAAGARFYLHRSRRSLLDGIKDGEKDDRQIDMCFP